VAKKPGKRCSFVNDSTDVIKPTAAADRVAGEMSTTVTLLLALIASASGLRVALGGRHIQLSSAAAAALRVAPALMSDGDETSSGGDGVRLIKDLLCQRSIQTQLYVYNDMKDDFRKTWLRWFSARQGTYPLCSRQQVTMLHSHRAMGGITWDEFLMSLVNAPQETHAIEVPS
jgi:hypothetical protein